MRIATGDAVVLLDGDLQDPPELIEEFYAEVARGLRRRLRRARAARGDAVPARSPTRPSTASSARPSYVPMPLDAGDFSLIDRRVVDALNQLPENNRFLRGLRAWVGFRQTGVPYVRPERMFGRTDELAAQEPRLGAQGDPLVLVRPARPDHVAGARDGRLLVRRDRAADRRCGCSQPELAPRGFTTLFCHGPASWAASSCSA